MNPIITISKKKKKKIAANRNYHSQTADSLVYEIETVDVYEDFAQNKEMSDFSNILVSQNITIIQPHQFLVK